MSKSKIDENKVINHYFTAVYFKAKEYFVHLPDCKRLTFYNNLIRAVKKEDVFFFKQSVTDTLNDHIAYIEKEKNFKKLLTEDQLKQFEELRQSIVMWYAMQKEVLKLGIGENEIIQMAIQQQENEENNCRIETHRSLGTIGILGLSFKPGSDDVRDTPAVKIIQELKKLGYQDIIAYDPIAMNEFRQKYPDITIDYAESLAKAYDKSDVLAIVTAWEEFRITPSLGNKKIIDCRYML